VKLEPPMPQQRSAPMAMTLWLHLASAVTLVMLLCFGGFGIYMASAQEALAAAEVGVIARAIAHSVDAAVADDILERRLDNIETLLLHLAMVGQVRELSVADASGRVLARVRRQGEGPSEADYIDRTPLALSDAARERRDAISYRYLTPIRRGERIGMVEVSASLDGLVLVRSRIYAATARTTLIALLLGVAILGLTLRGTTRSLKLAMGFAARLGAQQGARLTLPGRVREVHALAAVLNRISTELASQHQALRESELRKSVILEVALDCFITIDDAGRIVDHNPATETTFGYPRAQLRGMPVDALIVPPRARRDGGGGMARYLAATDSAGFERIELTALRADGLPIAVEMAIIPFTLQQRQYYSGTLRDITARKMMEADSAAANALLRQTMHELEYQKFALDQHALVSIADARGQISYVNRKLEQLSGYGASSLLGASHRLLKSGLHDANFFRQMWDTIGAGQVWHGQIANRNRDGGIYWVASTIVPWLDEHGMPYQYVSIGTDISEQKANEHALAEARARELEIGNAIQRSLLWGSVPAGLDGVSIASHSDPSQGVDGDFFAINRYSEHCFELLVGDVMGKGVPAALIGAAVKNTYSQVLLELSLGGAQHSLPAPQTIVNAMHCALTPGLITLNSFVTLALYRFDLARATLTLVNAGHTPGLLLRRGEGRIESVLGANMPIGVLETELYTERCLPIAAGDALLAYSDGVTETRNEAGDEYGEARLSALLGECTRAGLPASMTLQALQQRLRDFAGQEGLRDDQTAILIALDQDPAVRQQTFSMAWQLDALAALRHNVARAAADYPDAVRDGLVLASFEAATNIVRHVPRRVVDSTLVCRIWHHADALEVELMYVGEPFVAAVTEPDFSGEREGGFGLFIIMQSVDRVDYGCPVAGVCSIRLRVRGRAVDGGGDA
jgi:sigma-B regulation protein RsbU (phosphoserine phosphatase)